MSTDRLLVPVANPETADRLIDTAIDVARDRDLEVLVLTVVTVPMQLSLEKARADLEVDEAEAVVRDAVETVRKTGLRATGRVRFGREVPTSVLAVAEDESVETILLGWRGRPRRRDVVLGGHIDTVLSKASCDVLVKRIDRDDGTISSVLVPVAGGPNTTFAAETAGAIAREHDAGVELLTVLSSDHDESAVRDARELLDGTVSALGSVPAVDRTVLAGDVVDTIVDRSSRHDVTVVGAAERRLLRRVLVGDVPEAVGREAESAVVMARRPENVKATLWRRFRRRIRSLLGR